MGNSGFGVDVAGLQKFALFGQRYDIRAGVAEMPCVYGLFLRLFGWQNLLNTDLIYKVLTFQVGEVRPLFIVSQMRPNSLCHHHNE